MKALGIDIGGSGIKGGIVDTEIGEMISERHRIDTPHPATPEAIVDTMKAIVAHFKWKGPIGCGYPGVVRNQVLMTAANLDKSCIGSKLGAMLSKKVGSPTWVINDADAAGLAEVHFGAGKGKPGVVLLVTIGTGLGTALFIDGKLVPNTELGHLILKRGVEAEKYAAASVKKKEDLSLKAWAKRFDECLELWRAYLWPDLFIVGGGIAKKADKFLDYFKVDATVVAAEQGNLAGIVGAAMAARLAHDAEHNHK